MTQIGKRKIDQIGSARALLERDDALEQLSAAVRDAAGGHGCAVLVTGEAGIGKTSVVREFLVRTAGRVKVLAGGCDNLVTPRPFGPLRDATAGSGGKLETALRDGSADEILAAALAEAAWPAPNVLVVEDLHWVDDATVDVLAYLARRLSGLPVVLVATYRDEEVSREHPVRRLLGALSGSLSESLSGARLIRLPLRPLSPAAVGQLAVGSDRDPRVLHQLSGGNPFYVTEALATPGVEVPATVADAVLARLRTLHPDCRRAVEQLSVVPTPVELELAEALLGDALGALAAAEESGILRLSGGGLTFRHELARRAVEQSLAGLRRRELHRAVVAALLVAPERQLARLVHHATQAGDGATVSRLAPRAGREAVAAGANRQALAHFSAALRHAHRLEPAELARVIDEHAWELYNAHRFPEALDQAERAVGLYRQLGEQRGLGEALVRLSRHRYMHGDPDGAVQASEEALLVIGRRGAAAGGMAYAATYHGAVLALTGSTEEAGATLRRAADLAGRCGRTDLVALCLNYQSIAEPDLDAEQRLELLRTSLRTALENGDHEIAARAYTNISELLYRFHRLDELERTLTEGLRFTDERGFPSHAYNLGVHRALLDARRGDWQAATSRLLALVDSDADPGMLELYSLPPYARLLARSGDPDVEPILERAWQRAQQQRMLLGLAFAGAALIEWAWLNQRPDRAARVLDAWQDHASRPGAEHASGELYRYAARAGVQVPSFADCPQPWGAGLRGDWRSAAQGWAELGDPYERALELAESGEVEPTIEALRVLDGLGATAAAHLVRKRLRGMGVHRIPRGVSAVARANPAGLTRRQLDVLDLLGEGLTNAEIADRLVVSVRTIDSHVAAVLSKLRVRSRRDAARAAHQYRP